MHYQSATVNNHQGAEISKHQSDHISVNYLRKNARLNTGQFNQEQGFLLNEEMKWKKDKMSDSD